MKYIFQGGTPNHPCKGLICTLGWQFETSEHFLVYFENDPRNIGFEMASMDELEEIV